MIAFDSNVLVRHYLTDPDEPRQSQEARRLVENALAKGYDVYLSQIVLCESVWVLERCYKVSRKARIEFLHSILHDPPFQAEAPEQVAKALKQFSDTRADFADCLIASNAKAHGCKKTFTFDKKAKTIPGMAAVDYD